ncbi:CheA signal transduction histidine kinase [Methylocella silvestris BL2]|uniref:Chemotaxis protein CheA n=1 Tax=Methylocella silvestris (strain DSM 15510 / CIP 108128 / LMG 27833 / NCIMB 13906 / BL2) TaxID=395965 RepID=B8ESS5_METSB|nr:chemotaxis protein CheA [Methylocella silvestris]ACK50410.1 CheA signal transduction histidine kinase [Methylocella silvestris BL2]
MDAMAAIKQTFFQECEEQLAELEAGLTAILDGDGDGDPETVNAVFRAVHSIKGGAGAFSLDDLVRFAHIFETALDHVRAGRLAPSPDLLKIMLRAADALADLVRAARDETSVEPQRFAALASELKAFDPAAREADAAAGDPGGVDEEPAGNDEIVFRPILMDESLFDEMEAPAAAAPHLFKIRFRPKPALYAKANEAALLLREVSNLGECSVVCDASDLPLLPDLDPEGACLTFLITLSTDRDEASVREIFEFVEWDCDLDIAEEIEEEAGGDIAALVERLQASVEAERAALEEAKARGDRRAENTAARAPAAASIAPGVAQGDRSDAIGGTGQTGRSEPAKTDPVKDPGKADLAAKGDQPGPSIRVDLERVDRLINLVGELVINQAMLAQRVLEEGLARASGVATGLDELEQLTREIQDSVMAIRAQPVKSVFQRMPRLVREVAAMTGKAVRLVTDGENTEVDKTVIERIADPLTHMIRNAIDHGLEAPDIRVKAGKPEEGVVHLSALHRSGRIVIEVSDDGAGIDRPRVKAIAADKGLIAPDAALSDDEIDNLIFLPGFSTAAAISDISGRGVGMDVVRRSIQALGGRISIQSRPGRGSTFTMSLPLTLAVLDGMVVTVGGQTLVVPLTAIVETLQPKVADVHEFGGGARVIAIRDQFTPLIDVGRELGYRADNADPLAGVALLVESEGGARNAMLVDAILGQRQVVIKSLEANYRHVPGIAAATILGDGRVALILDVDAIVATSRADSDAHLLAAAG